MPISPVQESTSTAAPAAQEPTRTPAAAEEKSSEGPGTFATLLALIPDTEDTRHVIWISDYARVRELFDIELPADQADDDLQDYKRQILGFPGRSGERKDTGVSMGPFISGFKLHAIQTLERRDYLAFDARNVDQSIMTNSPEETTARAVFEVVKGRFDAGATGRAIDRCSDCPPPLREEYQGIEFYVWGEDLAVDSRKRFTPPAFDVYGRGGRIAVLDGYVLRTVETPGMKSLIDTHLSQRRSLADNPDMLLAAKAMDDQGPMPASLWETRRR